MVSAAELRTGSSASAHWTIRSGLVRSAITLICAYAALAATTWLTIRLPGVTLSAGLLLMLLEVVIVAALSNVILAVVVAISAVLLANWFLVPPTRTWIVGSAEDLILLVVFVVSAVLSSLAVSLALRRTRQAHRAAAEAAGLRESLARPAGEADPVDVLHTLALAHDLDAVHLVDSGGAIAAQWQAKSPQGPPRETVHLPDSFSVVGWGPPMIGTDRVALQAIALSALRAHQVRLLSDEAAQAREHAEADRARSALLAAVGHDLRTPLAAISLAAGTLQHAGMNLTQSDQAALVRTIAESAGRLDELVQNLLDLGRLEAGKLLVRLAPVDLATVVAEAALSLPDEPVQIAVAEDLPLARADAGLLRQVLVNLLTNGVRHGGGVRCEGRSGPGTVGVAVIDHGPGIPTERMAAMFEAFTTTRSGDGGLGMGLAIARGFTEAMGGSLVATPTPGGGLTVTVILPRDA